MLGTKSPASYLNNNTSNIDSADVGIENKIFPTTFSLLIGAGIWRPTTMKSRLSHVSYNVYTAFCFIGVVMLILTILLNNMSDESSLIESWYMVVIFSHGLLKFTNLLCRRAKIIDLLEKCIMDEGWTVARNKDESAIMVTSENSEKFITHLWLSLLLVNGLGNALNPLIHENPNNSLMFECYSPCDRSIPSCFWTAYAYQLFGHAISSTAHVGSDCLIFNLIERINTHVKIFVDRLHKLPARVESGKLKEGFDVSQSERLLLRECIQDHRKIYESVRDLNDTFYDLITIQFVTTISIICTNIYFLSKQELFSPDFIAVCIFLGCVLTQNFIFCWYGYKLPETSARVVDAIFNMDWFILGEKTKKTLLFMMMSASNEVKLFNNVLVNLSPETFLKLVKLSYSAFNLLQQSKTEELLANSRANERRSERIAIEDQVFPTTFLLLKAAGVWTPTTLKSRRSQYMCYRIYSAFCFVSVLALVVTISIENVVSSNASILESWYMLVIFSHGLLKIKNLQWRRVKIIHLLKECIMDERWSIARNQDERAIINESKRAEKFITHLWLSLLLVNGLGNALNPLIHENPNNSLIFECYSPCDRSIPSCFWTAYAYQLFGYTISSMVHVSCDCLIFNFIERINAHMMIFIDRLQKLPSRVVEGKNEGCLDPSRHEARLLKECIQDHRGIYESVEELNNAFYEVITIQFVTSISIVCTNIYFLSKQELFSADFIGVLIFLGCVLTQNFIFCWYGYKLSESSSYIVNGIFNMDWLVLNKRSKGLLLFAMMSASNEIKIFHNALVNLSPETFLQVPIKIANDRIDEDGIPDVEGLEKRVFPRTFLLLIVGGLWAPTTIKSRSLFACYQVYTVFCFISLCMLIITILIDNVLSDDKTMESLVEYAYMLIVFINGLVRIINLVSRRDKILRLLQGNIMLDRWQSHRDDEELAIIAESKISEKYVYIRDQSQYPTGIIAKPCFRLVLKIWGSLILMNGISNSLNPIIHENPDNTLMFECYSPCDRSVSSCFWMTYSYQLFGYFILSVAHVGVDCLIYNFIDRINSHYKIFLNRLLKLPARVREEARNDVAAALLYENNYIKECVADHHSVYKATEELNGIFNELVFVQFMSCISLLCTNIYFLSKQELFSPPFIAVFVFLCCALTQNFFFCLYGNKLSQTGSEISCAIFGMDWQELQQETKRKLLFIMLLASKEIALFNNAVVNLSPETWSKYRTRLLICSTNQPTKIEVADIDGVEKKIFRRTFILLIAGGLWTPTTTKSQALYTCYQIYTVFSFVGVLMLIVTILIDDTMRALIEYGHVLIVITNGLVRIINLASRRDKILHLLRSNIMLNKWQNCRDDEELAIIAKSEISEKYVYIRDQSQYPTGIIAKPCFRLVLKIWGSLILMNDISNTLNPIIRENPENTLMFKCYSPCDRSISSCFWMTYSYQLFGFYILNAAHVGVDCLIFNFIDRIDAHYKIFLNRLLKLPARVREKARDDVAAALLYENKYIKECVADHHSIYKKSSEIADAIFGMDWQDLQKETRRKLLFIMLLASKEIALFNNAIVNLSPETFLKLLKVSYSAFNLLNQSTKK
ncbi:hypothetical protein TSAR_009914 [Trichomalopsis sarcophagae]|uniref:Odorant receptor n=1 Tax=Trichomalopsis sarcophagae TaxID=543379 RepID=A0A232FEE4_9HYME|nr:hypothetical protein TSAR_009914 [Trichomalopsis sarcophagae]